MDIYFYFEYSSFFVLYHDLLIFLYVLIFFFSSYAFHLIIFPGGLFVHFVCVYCKFSIKLVCIHSVVFYTNYLHILEKRNEKETYILNC